MISLSAVRRTIQRWTLLFALSVLAGCQSMPPADPAPISFREDLVFEPPLEKTVDESTPISDTARSAAERGMNWLMDARLEDGSWESPHPVGVSALALSAALRDERMTEPDFRSYWEQTVRYLIAQQTANGSLSRAGGAERPYEHALAVRALSDALSVYTISGLQETVEKGVRLILDHQQAGGGWYYGYARGTRRSTPLTVVQMDALHAAARNGIQRGEIIEALERAAEDLADVQDPDTGRFGYTFRGVGKSVINGYALYGLQLAGRGLSISSRKGWENAAPTHPDWPTSLRWPLFAAYYNHQAVYHLGGAPWRAWRDPFQEELLAGQEEDGQWTGPFLEQAFGPSYATALGVLMLRATDRTPRLVTQYDHSTPGPVYRLRNEDGEAHILVSGIIEPFDAVVADAWLDPLLQDSDAVLIEGSARAWIHALSESARIQSEQDSSDPLPPELRSELNRLFSVPPGARSIWDTAPPWAIALFVWGHRIEETGRDFESTVEQQLRRRIPPGVRTISMIQPEAWTAPFESLTRAEELTLLRHALEMREDLPLILDRLADAWSSGDEDAFMNEINNLHGPDPDRHTLYDRLFDPVRTLLTESITRELPQHRNPLFILPAWHVYGANGILTRLQERGYAVQHIP